jgi:hypothetical protein
MDRIKMALATMAISVGISGCIATPSYPSSILNDLNDAEPPCWRGICPGVTPLDAAVDRVRNAWDPDALCEATDTANPWIAWEIRKDAREAWGVRKGIFYYRDDVVTQLVLTISGRLIYADVVDRFGDPDLIQIGASRRQGRLYAGFFYPELGLDLMGWELWSSNSLRVQIAPEWSAMEAFVYVPYMYDVPESGVQPWEGWNHEYDVASLD